MVLDILVVVLFVIFGALGYQKGLMRGLISLLKTSVAIIIAIAISKPIASLIDNLTKVSKAFGTLFQGTVEALGAPFLTQPASAAATVEQLNTIHGEGVTGKLFATIVRTIINQGGERITEFTNPATYAAGGLGFIMLLIITAVVVFIGILLLLRFLNKVIDKLTRNDSIFVVDRILGLVFGAARCFITLMSAFALVFIISSIPFASGVADWLFNGSVVTKFLYELAGGIFVWILETFNIVTVMAKLFGLS